MYYGTLLVTSAQKLGSAWKPRAASPRFAMFEAEEPGRLLADEGEGDGDRFRFSRTMA
jgi:hypothetical protein